MREFLCTVRLRLREGEPTAAAFKRLNMELIGFSKSDPIPSVLAPKPEPQVIRPAGIDPAEFGKF